LWHQSVEVLLTHRIRTVLNQRSEDGHNKTHWGEALAEHDGFRGVSLDVRFDHQKLQTAHIKGFKGNSHGPQTQSEKL
jgi:hypothetical protein